jgi:hypothetical protein
MSTSEPTEAITIDCDRCAMRRTATCDDCVVTFLLAHGERDAVVLDLAEQRAVRLLSAAGMVPELRHRPVRPAAADGTMGR